MTVSVSQDTTTNATPWAGFRSGLWQKEVNVRDFIQQNYEPYDGDGSFLKPATGRTKKGTATTMKKAPTAKRRKLDQPNRSATPSSRITTRPPKGIHAPRSLAGSITLLMGCRPFSGDLEQVGLHRRAAVDGAEHAKANREVARACYHHDLEQG